MPADAIYFHMDEHYQIRFDLLVSISSFFTFRGIWTIPKLESKDFPHLSANAMKRGHILPLGVQVLLAEFVFSLSILSR